MPSPSPVNHRGVNNWGPRTRQAAPPPRTHKNGKEGKKNGKGKRRKKGKKKKGKGEEEKEKKKRRKEKGKGGRKERKGKDCMKKKTI